MIASRCFSERAKASEGLSPLADFPLTVSCFTVSPRRSGVPSCTYFCFILPFHSHVCYVVSFRLLHGSRLLALLCHQLRVGRGEEPANCRRPRGSYPTRYVNGIRTAGVCALPTIRPPFVRKCTKLVVELSRVTTRTHQTQRLSTYLCVFAAHTYGYWYFVL